MNFKEIEDQIQDGDYGLVDGKGLASDIIELVTGGHISHVFKWVRLNGVLTISEFWEPGGYQDNPAAIRLPQIEGNIYWGKAPDGIRGNSEAAYSIITEFRNNPNLDRYGLETLPLVAAADDLGAVISPDSVQCVCSVYAQRWDEACGAKFASLMSPADYGNYAKELVPIEL